MSVLLREPLFRVDSVSRVRRKGANAFTDMEDLRPLWKLTLRNDLYIDRSIDLFFETEVEARRTRKGPISATGMISLFTPYSSMFVVQDIRMVIRMEAQTAYSDNVVPREMWEVVFDAEKKSGGSYLGQESGRDHAGASCFFPSKKEASFFAIGRHYAPLDVLKAFRIVVVTKQPFTPTPSPEPTPTPPPAPNDGRTYVKNQMHIIWVRHFDNYVGIAEWDFWDVNGKHKAGYYPNYYVKNALYIGYVPDFLPPGHRYDPSVGGGGYLVYTFDGGFGVRDQNNNIQEVLW